MNAQKPWRQPDILTSAVYTSSEVVTFVKIKKCWMQWKQKILFHLTGSRSLSWAFVKDSSFYIESYFGNELVFYWWLVWVNKDECKDSRFGCRKSNTWTPAVRRCSTKARRMFRFLMFEKESNLLPVIICEIMKRVHYTGRKQKNHHFNILRQSIS